MRIQNIHHNGITEISRSEWDQMPAKLQSHFKIIESEDYVSGQRISNTGPVLIPLAKKEHTNKKSTQKNEKS